MKLFAVVFTPLSSVAAFAGSAPNQGARFGAVPTVAEPWSSSRPSPRLRSCSVLRPRSSHVLHETNFEKPESLPVFRHDHHSCALPPNKVLLPPPQSSRTVTMLRSNQLVQAIPLFCHPPHCPTSYLLPPINTIENP
jgi:hypothetical protein